MYSLILDSGNIDLIVGLAKDGEVIAETNYPCLHRQSELMIPEIELILQKNKANPKEISEIFVTVGPGSYVGIRIGLTIAKIYGMALNIPVYALSSLKVLQKEGVPSICLINARSNRCYFAVYRDNEVIEKDQILPNEEIKKYIFEHPDYAVCGDYTFVGADTHEPDVVNNFLRLKNNEDKVENILTLKAVYLKD